jgi:acyl-CoA synthetase (AMP-forming)/AMP-acid ligase II
MSTSTTEPSGPAGTPAPTEARTTAELVRALAAVYGDRPAVALGEDVLTYAQLERRSAALARGLLARGVGKGTRVGVLHADGPSFVVAWFALTRLGALAVPISTFYRSRELRHVVRHADLQGLLLQRRIRGTDEAALLEQAFEELAGATSTRWVLRGAPHLRWVVVDGAGATGTGAPAWAHDPPWLADGAAEVGIDDELLAAVEAEVHPGDLATMIYTSGQSADPKGVLHTQGGVLRKVHYLRSMMGLTGEHQPPNTMPFFWVGGLGVTLLCTLEAGGCVRCSERPVNPAPPLGAVGRPLMAQPLPGWQAFPGLGMTETFAMYGWGSVPAAEGRLPYTPMDAFEPGYDVKVADPDGHRCPEGVPGEICLRGPTVTVGHHKVDRDRTFDHEGYFRTGDEGVVEDGVLHFLGRLGDMIKTAGANVAPPEVERELVDLDGVARAAVVAIPDDERGQLVGAALVAEPGVELDVPALLAELRDRISSYKVPRLVAVVDHDDIPLTPTNKVDKRKLAALLVERGTRR